MGNGREWREFFKEDLAPAFVFSTDADSDREAEIDQLLSLSLEQAFVVIVESVPALDNTAWLDFQQRLAVRARDDSHALVLLKMAHLMVEAENKIREVLSLYDMLESVAITRGLLRIENKIDQFVLLAFLHHLARTDAKARAVWGIILG